LSAQKDWWKKSAPTPVKESPLSHNKPRNVAAPYSRQSKRANYSLDNIAFHAEDLFKLCIILGLTLIGVGFLGGYFHILHKPIPFYMVGGGIVVMIAGRYFALRMAYPSSSPPRRVIFGIHLTPIRDYNRCHGTAGDGDDRKGNGSRLVNVVPRQPVSFGQHGYKIRASPALLRRLLMPHLFFGLGCCRIRVKPDTGQAVRYAPTRAPPPIRRTSPAARPADNTGAYSSPDRHGEGLRRAWFRLLPLRPAATTARHFGACRLPITAENHIERFG
jgi:hypothetical protein